MKVYVFSANSQLVAEMQEYKNKDSAFQIVGTNSDGEIGLEEVLKINPDAILVDLVLSNLDGLTVLARLKACNCPSKLYVMSYFFSDSYGCACQNHNVEMFFKLPQKLECIANAITGKVFHTEEPASIEGDLVFDRKKLALLNEKISTIFISIGIQANNKGYSYLREGVKMLVMNPKLINKVTKELYPKIAEKFETTASKVERAIRHAIEVAWNKGRVDCFNNIFGVKVFSGNDRPTNSEFLALVADKLLLDFMHD